MWQTKKDLTNFLCFFGGTCCGPQKHIFPIQRVDLKSSIPLAYVSAGAITANLMGSERVRRHSHHRA
jgi:hypothetical protein